jgi:Fur family ferric uptake transcriptional regulator
MVNRKNTLPGPAWREHFAGRGYRMTAGRKAIMEILAATDQHLSADDIYVKLHAKFPGIGLASVYRTVDVLARMGMIFKFDFGDGKARYEPAENFAGKKHHHHLVCTQCNRVVDYTDFAEQEMDLVHDAEKGLLQRYGFKTTSHLIQFNGICGECQNPEKNKRMSTTETHFAEPQCRRRHRE